MASSRQLKYKSLVLFCPYPFCSRHKKGFKNPKALSAHLSVTDCLHQLPLNNRANRLFTTQQNEPTEDAGATHAFDNMEVTLTQPTTPTTYSRNAVADRLHPTNHSLTETENDMLSTSSTNTQSSISNRQNSSTSNSNQLDEKQDSNGSQSENQHPSTMSENSSFDETTGLHSKSLSSEQSSDPEYGDYVAHSTSSSDLQSILVYASQHQQAVETSSLSIHGTNTSGLSEAMAHSSIDEHSNWPSSTNTDNPPPLEYINVTQQHDHHTPSASQLQLTDIQQPLLLYSTPEQRSVISLMRLLEDIDAPDYALNEILKWAEEATEQDINFSQCLKTKKANINWVKNVVHGSNYLLPKEKKVELEDGRNFKVVVFDFAAQLLSLLQDKSIMQWENLSLNENQPFHPYLPPDGCISECNSGTCYKKMYKRLQIDPTKNQLLCPIILYVDKTNIDKLSRFNLEPMSFTCSIFKQHIRSTIKGWRMLGFIQNMDHLSRAQNSNGERCQCQELSPATETHSQGSS